MQSTSRGHFCAPPARGVLLYESNSTYFSNFSFYSRPGKQINLSFLASPPPRRSTRDPHPSPRLETPCQHPPFSLHPIVCASSACFARPFDSTWSLSSPIPSALLIILLTRSTFGVMKQSLETMTSPCAQPCVCLSGPLGPH